MKPDGSPPEGSPLTGTRLLRAAELIKGLGHPLRLRLVEALADEERSVSALQVSTGASQAQVSRQLAALKAHEIVACRRDGAFVYYRLREARVRAMLRCLRAYEPGDPRVGGVSR
jgi:ArsR family transcriptional regulator